MSTLCNNQQHVNVRIFFILPLYSNLIHWEIVPHAKYSFANETDELIVVRPSYVMLKLHFFMEYVEIRSWQESV